MARMVKERGEAAERTDEEGGREETFLELGGTRRPALGDSDHLYL